MRGRAASRGEPCIALGPAGELLYRQVGEKFSFYVGEYMTVRASGATGCASYGTCAPLPATVEADYHVLLAATRIVSVSPSRTLYYYRSRLGTVVATSLAGGVLGAQYRYDPYGKLQVALNETAATASEYGYTNALRLTGDLWHLKARVYDAAARVFLQPDSVDRYRYAYVWGDPANLSDPTGLLPNRMVAAINEVLSYLDPRTWFDTSTLSKRQQEDAKKTEAMPPASPVSKSEKDSSGTKTALQSEKKEFADPLGASTVTSGYKPPNRSEHVAVDTVKDPPEATPQAPVSSPVEGTITEVHANGPSTGYSGAGFVQITHQCPDEPVYVELLHVNGIGVISNGAGVTQGQHIGRLQTLAEQWDGTGPQPMTALAGQAPDHLHTQIWHYVDGVKTWIDAEQVLQTGNLCP
jgi:RHS repeat-associated protein